MRLRLRQQQGLKRFLKRAHRQLVRRGARLALRAFHVFGQGKQAASHQIAGVTADNLELLADAVDAKALAAGRLIAHLHGNGVLVADFQLTGLGRNWRDRRIVRVTAATTSDEQSGG